MSYQSTTDRAAIIRKTLRDDYGWSSRKVSVRSDYFSLGSSIDVTIKDPSVSYEAVEAVANKQQSIRRCEYSGEILSGSNRYVSVSYSREAEEVLAAPYIAPLQAAMDRLDPDTTSCTHADVISNITVAHAGNGGYQLWTDRAGINFGNCAENGAFYVARYIEDAKPTPWPGDFKSENVKSENVILKPAPRQVQKLTLLASLLR